jgi:hypothetical protein
MAIDKAMYGAPMGLEAVAGQPDLEIEIDNPDMVTLDDGSVEITLIPGGKEETDGVAFDANLAEHMDEAALQSLGEDLVED